MNGVNDLSKVGYMIIYEIDNMMEKNEMSKLGKEVKQKLYFGDSSAQSIVKFNIKGRTIQNNEVYILTGKLTLVKMEGGSDE